MNRILILCLGVICLSGCAGVERMQATSDAIHSGLIEGISDSDVVNSIVWSFPSNPAGPYTKLGELDAEVKNSVSGSHAYVFYLGKSRETGHWEVFASTIWRNGKWEPVRVKVPLSTR